MKYIIVLAFIIISIGVSAQQERKHIRQGNREYEKAIIDSVTVDTTRYQKAEVDYRKALEKDPNNWDALYNLGNSLFKQGKYEEAMRQFQAVAGMDNENKEELAYSFHNLGNSFIKTNKLQEAIEAYKSALRNNPSDMETKYNLAWAQNQLKNQQEQQQNQNQDQEDNKEDQEKKDQKENQDQQNQDQQEQEQRQKEQQKQQQDQAKENEENKDQISKEDAMRILEALQNDEKQVQEKVQKQKVKAKKKTIEKDW